MANVSFQRQLDALTVKLKDYSLGIQGHPVVVDNPKSSQLPSCQTDCSTNNIFDVTVNVAGTLRKWQMIFHPEHPLLPPDVIFSDENFFPDISTLKSFTQWNSKSENALVEVMTELFQSYLQHQRSAILEYPQLKNQFEELIAPTEYGSTCEIDIQRNGPGTYNDVVKLQIPLHADFSKLPPYLQPKNPGKNGCCLSFTFEPPNLSTVTPTLQFSPAVEAALGEVSNMRIPSYNSTLTSYVNKVGELLESTISIVVERYERRKSLVLLLLSQLNGSVLEYDVETFAETAFMLHEEDIHFVLFVMLSEQFPLEQPSLVLQSSGNAYAMSLKDCKHAPHSTSEQIFQNIKDCVSDNFELFKKNCLAAGEKIT